MVRGLDPLVFNDVMMSRLGKGLGYGTVPASRSSSVLVSAFLATVLYEYSYGGIACKFGRFYKPALPPSPPV